MGPFIGAGWVHASSAVAASKWLERAKLYREQADYGDFYIVSVQEAEAQLQSAREFIEEIETVIQKIK